MVIDIEFNHNGIRFVRKYWGEFIKYGYQPPPIVFLSPHTLTELVRQDLRYFVLHSGSIKLLSIPFDLETLVRTVFSFGEFSSKIDTVGNYLEKSCVLASEGIIEHKRNNLGAPFSLLRGAYYANNIDSASYKKAIRQLWQREEIASEEVLLYDAISGRSPTEDITSSPLNNIDNFTLQEITYGKHILVIDDEADSSGLTETLETILGDNVVSYISGKWGDFISLIQDKRAHTRLVSQHQQVK